MTSFPSHEWLGYFQGSGIYNSVSLTTFRARECLALVPLIASRNVYNDPALMAFFQPLGEVIA
jgi:hypothetical protein